MRGTTTALLIAIALALGACGDGGARDRAETPTVGASTETAPKAVPPATPAPAPEEGAADEQQLTAIPDVYRGRWALNRADCAGQPGLTRLNVSADELRYYEGISLLKRIEPEGDGVALVVDHESEGDRETMNMAMALEDGRLTVFRGGETIVYMRCP